MMTNNTRNWGTLFPKEVDAEMLESKVVLGLMDVLNRLEAPFDPDAERRILSVYFPEHYDPEDFMTAGTVYDEKYGEYMPYMMRYWIDTRYWTPFTGYLAFDGWASDTQEFIENFRSDLIDMASDCISYDDNRTPIQITRFLNNLGRRMSDRVQELTKILSALTVSDSNVYPMQTITHYDNTPEQSLA